MEELWRELRSDLGRALGRNEAILFTGAGFTAGARDRAGRALPSSEELTHELWAVCFDDEPYDGESSLQDLFDVALTRAPGRLRSLLAERLRVGDHPLPDHHGAALSVPWRCVYTLNVDDLEQAAARQFELPHRVRSLVPWSPAVAAAAVPSDEATLDVVHLNGAISDQPHQVTFSTLQYASRVDGGDPIYHRLACEMKELPFVFVGTGLDEVTLWRHVQREVVKPARPRPRSWLIARHLSRARQCLLGDLGVRWIPSTAEDLARAVLGPPPPRRPATPAT